MLSGLSVALSCGSQTCCLLPAGILWLRCAAAGCLLLHRAAESLVPGLFCAEKSVC